MPTTPTAAKPMTPEELAEVARAYESSQGSRMFPEQRAAADQATSFVMWKVPRLLATIADREASAERWANAAAAAEGRARQLEGALRKCANLARNQETSPSTTKQAGEDIGRIVTAALATSPAPKHESGARVTCPRCQTSYRMGERHGCAAAGEHATCGAVHPFRTHVVCARPLGHLRLHCNVAGTAFGYEWSGTETCDCLLDPTMFHHRPSCPGVPAELATGEAKATCLHLELAYGGGSCLRCGAVTPSATKATPAVCEMCGGARTVKSWRPGALFVDHDDVPYPACQPAPESVAQATEETNLRHETAFLVGIIETASGAFLGADVFSEQTPTLGATRWPFTIAAGLGHDYASGLRSLAGIVASPHYRWVHRFIADRGRSSLGLPPLPTTPAADSGREAAVVAWQALTLQGRASAYALLSPEKCMSECISDSVRERALAVLRSLAPAPDAKERP